jgi:hypothetical protein
MLAILLTISKGSGISIACRRRWFSAPAVSGEQLS